MDTKMAVSNALSAGAMSQEEHDDVMNALEMREAVVEVANKMQGINWLSFLPMILSFFVPQSGPLIAAINALLKLLNINFVLPTNGTDPKPN